MRSRPWLRRTAELVGAGSFAVAQPVLDVLGRNATFFVAQGAELGGILVLVLLLVFAIPLTFVAVELLVGTLSRTAARGVHVAFVAVLVTVAAVPPVAKTMDLGLRSWGALTAACLILATVAYLRLPRSRQLLAWVAPGALVFAGAFLFFSPVRELIFSGHRTLHAEPARSPVPVVMLVLDEVQLGSLITADGEVDAARHPGFAELAGRSTWYPNATTTGESTQWAIPSMLTGRWVREAKTPTSRNYPANLFTYLGGSQPIYANEYISRLCPTKVCERVGADPGLRSLLLDAGIVYLHVTLPERLAEGLLPPLEGKWAGFAPAPEAAGGNETDGGRPVVPGHHEFLGWARRDVRADHVDRFDAMLSVISARSAPALWYIHLALPHVPWRFLPTMQTFELKRRQLPGLVGETWIDSAAAVDHGHQRYMLQLGYTDRLLRQLIERLEDEGLFDDALFIVASDHGVSFRPDRSRRLLDEANEADLVPVPLFVKYPGQARGDVDRRNAELIDILPTVLDVLGIDAGRKLDGSSLRGADPRRATKRVFSGKSGPHVYGASIDGIDAAAQRIEDLFGPPGGPDDLYAMGPHRAMMGVEVDAYAPSSPEGSVTVTIEDPQAFDAVDPEGPFIPALVRGFVTGEVPAEEPVAVSLNGKIAGLGWTFEYEGRLRLNVIVSPRYFRSGKNDLEVFRILGPDSLERLPRAN